MALGKQLTLKQQIARIDRLAQHWKSVKILEARLCRFLGVDSWVKQEYKGKMEPERISDVWKDPRFHSHRPLSHKRYRRIRRDRTGARLFSFEYEGEVSPVLLALYLIQTGKAKGRIWAWYQDAEPDYVNFDAPVTRTLVAFSDRSYRSLEKMETLQGGKNSEVVTIEIPESVSDTEDSHEKTNSAFSGIASVFHSPG